MHKIWVHARVQHGDRSRLAYTQSKGLVNFITVFRQDTHGVPKVFLPVNSVHPTPFPIHLLHVF